MAFNDPRTPAELLLAPRLPESRSVVNFSSLKLNIGGAAAPGVISDSSQISGPLRTKMGAAIANKAAVQDLANSVNGVLSSFDAQTVALRNGTFVPPDPLLIPAANGIPNVASFFSFSTLAPGAPIPANFDATIQNRKNQLQSLSKVFSSVNSKTDFSGVSVVENTSPTTLPLASQIDIPSVPRLAQGGAVAQADPILKDKIAFVVTGVPIGSGKPSSWSRGTDIASNPPANLNPVVGQLFRDRKNQSTWSEPVTAYNTQFPYNRVQQSASGHVIEVDDTPGAERVHIFHRSGSFIEFHPDGSVVYKNMKDGYLISMADQFVKVNGKCHVAVDGGVTLYCKGNIDLQADGDINVQAKGDYNVYAQNINLRAKKTSKLDGTKIDLRYITLPSGIAMVTPMGGGPFFAPRVNIAAINADAPGNNLAALTSGPTPISGPTAQASTGDAPPAPPPESPLSNFSVYQSAVPEAISYRAHLFDTPEETSDFEMYSAHTSLQKSLGDVSGDPRQLAGTLAALGVSSVAPAVKPTVNYLNFQDFKGKYDYANNYLVGGTSFMLSDLVDVAIHPTIIADATTADSVEDVPTDSLSTGTNAQDPHGNPQGSFSSPDYSNSFQNETP